MNSVDIEELDIFGRESVQILITQKWNQIYSMVKYALFIPQILLLVSNLFWQILIRPVRSRWAFANKLFVFLQFVQILYFFSIEFMQLYVDWREYMQDAWNFINVAPLLCIIKSCVDSLN